MEKCAWLRATETRLWEAEMFRDCTSPNQILADHLRYRTVGTRASVLHCCSNQPRIAVWGFGEHYMYTSVPSSTFSTMCMYRGRPRGPSAKLLRTVRLGDWFCLSVRVVGSWGGGTGSHLWKFQNENETIWTSGRGQTSFLRGQLPTCSAQQARARVECGAGSLTRWTTRRSALQIPWPNPGKAEGHWQDRWTQKKGRSQRSKRRTNFWKRCRFG